MLIGVPTNHTLEALGGGHVWEVILGSTDEEVGESEPKEHSKGLLNAPPRRRGSWNSVLLGLLRNREEHASESPVQGQKGWGPLPSSVGCGMPLRALPPPSTSFWVAPARSWAVSPSVRESPQEEERCRSLKLEAVSMLETVRPLR